MHISSGRTDYVSVEPPHDSMMRKGVSPLSCRVEYVSKDGRHAKKTFYMHPQASPLLVTRIIQLETDVRIQQAPHPIFCSHTKPSLCANLPLSELQGLEKHSEVSLLLISCGNSLSLKL